MTALLASLSLCATAAPAVAATAAAAVATRSGSLVLADFKTGSKTSYYWAETNDPVMGGKSKGNWSVSDGVGTFQGVTRVVPFLKAPGFCNAGTLTAPAIDASAYADGAIVLMVRSSTPSYAGFKIAIQTKNAPRHHGGHELFGSFKATFQVPSASTEFQPVSIPLSRFSSDWSDYTGECTTKDPDGYQHQCCTPTTPSVCLSESQLSAVNGYRVWAEGVAGEFVIEIQSISASASLALKPGQQDCARVNVTGAASCSAFCGSHALVGAINATPEATGYGPDCCCTAPGDQGSSSCCTIASPDTTADGSVDPPAAPQCTGSESAACSTSALAASAQCASSVALGNGCNPLRQQSATNDCSAVYDCVRGSMGSLFSKCCGCMLFDAKSLGLPDLNIDCEAA